jgi:tRNA threonylcarbamoyl adenosine modification protein YeaZ
MKLLGIELSSAVGSIALLADGDISERTIQTPREQTARTLACVDELLGAAGLALRELDGVTFGRGPGSFTGLRVAAAHAQGMALASGVPLYPVSSLLALAQGAWRTTSTQRAVVCVDARMDEIYCGVFALAESVMAPVADEVIGAATDVARLAAAALRGAHGADGDERGGDGAGRVSGDAPYEGRDDPGAEPWAAIGDGFTCAHGATILAPLAARAARQLFDSTPAARDLFPRAIRDHEAGRATAPFAALPAYLREATAWRRY